MEMKSLHKTKDLKMGRSKYSEAPSIVLNGENMNVKMVKAQTASHLMGHDDVHGDAEVHFIKTQTKAPSWGNSALCGILPVKSLMRSGRTRSDQGRFWN